MKEEPSWSSDTVRPQETVLEGRYRLLERVGAGGMGEVFRARQLTVERDVAIKLISRDLAADARALERFENEARIISRLRHPNTLRLYDFGRLPDGRLFIVTEFLQGKPLDQALLQGPLGEARTIVTLRQVVESLVEAHASGVVHRDLKPHNLFLESVGDQEVVKVLDFGIAKLTAGASRTAAGAIIGTPAYMSPEQARGEAVDARSDLYSLGVIAHQCLTGQVPFPSDTPMGSLFKHISEAPPAIPPELASEPVRKLVSRLLAKDPAARPATAQEVRAALIEAERSLSPAGPGAPPDAFARTFISPGRRRIVPKVLITSAVALALALAVAGWTVRSRKAAVAARPGDTVYRVPVGGSPTLGPGAALVTIVEFGDFQCPFTKAIEAPLRELVAAHPDELRLVWKDYPMGMHPQAESASLLARHAFDARGREDFWTVHDALFGLQPELAPARLEELQRRLSVGPGTSGPYGDLAVRDINADVELASELGVTSVPTFFVNGRRVSGADTERLTQTVLDALDHARRVRESGVERDRLYDELTRGGTAAVPERLAPMPSSLASRPARGGGPDALPVVLYCDATNPFCAWMEPSFRKTLDQYGDRVRLVYFQHPDPTDPRSVRVARALSAAYAQKGDAGFWAFHDRLTRKVRDAGFVWPLPELFTPQAVEGIAAELGVTLPGDDAKPEPVEPLPAEVELPMVVIGGKRFNGGAPHHLLERAIEEGLGKGKGDRLLFRRATRGPGVEK